MNNHKKFALEQAGYLPAPNVRGAWYDTAKDRTHIMYPSEIDHPFCHELVKGLDETQFGRFAKNLFVIVFGPSYEVPEFPPFCDELFCAKPDQILQAYWEALHE